MVFTLHRVPQGDLVPDSVERMDAEAYPDGNRCSADVKQQMCDDGTMDVFVASEKRRDVGFTCVVRVDDTAYVMYIVTDRRSRGRGVGSFMLSRIKEEYEGCDLVLCCKDELVPFYARNGFVMTDILMNVDGRWDPVMTTGGYDADAVSVVADIMDTYGRTESLVEIGDDVTKINEACFDERIRYSTRDLQDMIDRGYGDVIVSRNKETGDVTGYACVLDHGSVSYLLLLGVAPSQRGKGIGKQLVKDVLLRRPGMNVFLDCEAHLVPFYESCGFTDSGYVIRYCGHEYHVMDLTCTVATDEDVITLSRIVDGYDSEPTQLVDPQGNVIEF